MWEFIKENDLTNWDENILILKKIESYLYRKNAQVYFQQKKIKAILKCPKKSIPQQIHCHLPSTLLDLQGRQKGPRVIHATGWSKMETPLLMTTDSGGGGGGGGPSCQGREAALVNSSIESRVHGSYQKLSTT